MDIKSNSLREVLSRAFGLNLAPDNLIEAKSGTDESAETGNLKIVDDELKQRAGRRLLAEEISKQKNIEGVVQRTDKLLESEPEISKSTEETDQGWVDECLDGAGKAYNDDLKDYWAKLLAGEIKHPGFYSLRAIDFMKKLSKKDAERIREMCKYVMYNVDKSDAIILRYKESPFLYSDLSFLMELRLIDSSNFIVKQYRFKNEDGGIDLFVPAYSAEFENALRSKNPEIFISRYCFEVEPHGDVLIPAGIKSKFDKNLALIACNKSGVCTNTQLIVGAQVIDSSYQGEWHIHLINSSNERVTIEYGVKLVQFIPVYINTDEHEVVDNMTEDEFYTEKTARGEGGFGSTGII